MQDPQLEFFWTVVWGYLSCWTFGAPQVLTALPREVFNGPALFFLLCVGFWELKSMSVTNPAYWVRDMVVDVLTKRRAAKARRWVLMAAVDCCGWIAAYWLYVRTLILLNQTGVVDVALQPPIKDLKVNYVYAIFTETMVTSLTQLTPLIGEMVGLDARLNNLVSSFIGVRIMIWGIGNTGAVMNPASSIAATFWWMRMGRSEPFSKSSPLHMFDIVLVYVVSPFLGAALAGSVEAVLISRGLLGGGGNNGPSPTRAARKSTGSEVTFAIPTSSDNNDKITTDATTTKKDD